MTALIRFSLMSLVTESTTKLTARDLFPCNQIHPTTDDQHLRDLFAKRAECDDMVTEMEDLKTQICLKRDAWALARSTMDSGALIADNTVLEDYQNSNYNHDQAILNLTTYIRELKN